MASISLSVEIDEVHNNDLDKIPDQVFQILSNSRATLAGVCVDVDEKNRSEDEDEEEPAED